MKKISRILSILLVIAIFTAMLFSDNGLFGDIEHNCVGDECPICATANACDNLLKTITVTAVALLILNNFEKFIRIIRRVFEALHNAVTLISLKIKLSN